MKQMKATTCLLCLKEVADTDQYVLQASAYSMEHRVHNACVYARDPAKEVEKVKRSPGRPRNKQVTVAPEQLDSLTIKAREFIGDSDALVAWLNERRMVAIVALGEALTDPKLFLEVTDDLLDAMKDLAPEKKKRGKS